MLVIDNKEKNIICFLHSAMDAPKKTKFEIAVIDKVKTLRIKKGFSQEYVAGLLGLTTSFIGQVESPNIASKYNLNHLNRLAYEMGCSPKDFMPDESIPSEGWENED